MIMGKTRILAQQLLHQPDVQDQFALGFAPQGR